MRSLPGQPHTTITIPITIIPHAHHYHHRRHYYKSLVIDFNSCLEVTMVNKGGVNVRVAHIEFDDASMLHFYQEHESNGKHYIEAVTGDQFVVIIDVTPEFNFEGQQSVEIRCSIDGAEDVAWFLFATEMARLRARHSMRRVNFFDTERIIDDQWMSCALSFGELQIDNSIVQTPHQAFMQSIKLGRIVVTVTRGTTSPWGPEPMFR